MNTKQAVSKPNVDTVRILNIDVHNWEFDAFVEHLEEGVVVTPNIDHFVRLHNDPNFYECYQQYDHVVCDSRVVFLLMKLLFPSNNLVAQIAGSDLFPAYCEHHKNNTDKVKVFLLGGSEASVKAAQEAVNTRTNSQIVVGGYSPPFGFEGDPQELQKIIQLIEAAGTTALAVGLGSPKQENWIRENRDKLPGVKLFFAIGATIDFQAGEVSRAPRWMVNMGLEWSYRLMKEPKRMFKRYFVDDMPFFWFLLKQRLGLYKNPWR
ncbi:MAG: glycosyltransferase [Alteromonadaceae bacterium]|nr:MAG: glycosyltransferase [Alteromonadaceae bacterium]